MQLSFKGSSNADDLKMRDFHCAIILGPLLHGDGSRQTSAQIKAAHVARNPDDIGTEGFKDS